VTTSNDVPYLDCAYKLQEYAGITSPGKATWPGRKQVWRFDDATGGPREDVVELVDVPGPDGARPLLQPVMRNGRRISPAQPLGDVRAGVLAQLERLPEALRRLSGTPHYKVTIGAELQALVERVDRRRRERLRLELLHQPCAVHLDRTRADVQLFGDLLVGAPGNDQVQCLAFARGQLFDALGNVVALGLAVLLQRALGHRVLHAVQQVLVVERSA
jgi:hypothetical protein